MDSKKTKGSKLVLQSEDWYSLIEDQSWYCSQENSYSLMEVKAGIAVTTGTI